jgi:hypothetical protein
VAAVLDALERGGDPWVLVRYYEYWMLRLHGMLPDLARCGACGADLDPAARVRATAGAGVLCAGCAAGVRERARWLDSDDRAFLGALGRARPAALPGAARPGPGGALEVLLRGTLEGYAERVFRAYRHMAAAASGR